jgi:uncharacterized BrkB/YihY/UPF0761 family membrane protein
LYAEKFAAGARALWYASTRFSRSRRPNYIRRPRSRLRWKLLIAASLLAAAAGAGAFYAAWYFLLVRQATLWAAALSLLAPLGAITYASVFVYRHTPRRRALQAAATALLASLLALAALTLGPVLLGRPAPELLPTPPTKNI